MIFESWKLSESKKQSKFWELKVVKMGSKKQLKFRGTIYCRLIIGIMESEDEHELKFWIVKQKSSQNILYRKAVKTSGME